MFSCLRHLSYHGASCIRQPCLLLGRHGRQQQFAGRSQHLPPAALKGPGDPTVMRRYIDIMDADDDADDDFLEEEQSDSTAKPQQRQTHLVAPDPNNPKNVKIRTSQYISSSTSLTTCPKDGRPEFAIIGRSNVGKSSLINMLTKNRNLALTSKQPGKTKCINHFLINGSWYLVDLPGYGYAKSSQKTRMDWNDFTKKFFTQRSTLLCVLLLVDASIPPQQVDLECAGWLTSSEVPFMVIFTKADKRKRGAGRVEENVSAFLAAMQADLGALPDSFLTSAEAGTGGSDLLRHLSALRESYLAAVGKPSAASPLLAAARPR
eukprot:jgi/Ulvmu1/6558/UM003_0195.1